MSGDELQRRLRELFSVEPPEPDVSPAEGKEEEKAKEVSAAEEGAPADVSSLTEPPSPQAESLSPTFAREYVERVNERMLKMVIGGAVVAGGIAVFALLSRAIAGYGVVMALPYLIGYALTVVLLLVRGIPSRVRAAVLIALAYMVAVFSILVNGVAGTGPWYLFSASVLSFVLIGPRVGFALAIFNVLLYESFAIAFRLGWLQVPRPIDLRTEPSQFWVISATFVLISFGLGVTQWLFAGLQERIRNLLHERVEWQQQMRMAGQARRRELEQVNERLQRQAVYMELGLEVGRIGAQWLDAAAYAGQVVQLIGDRLDLYLVELFAVDEERRYAILQAGAGPGTALSRPEQWEITPDSLLGQCVSSGRARFARENDVTSDPVLLPPTQVAAAFPLVARGEVIGALLLQGQEAEAISEDDVMSLTAVADQVAASFYGARAYQSLQERVREMETLQRYYVREAWEQFLPAMRETLFEYVRPGVPPLEGRLPPEAEHVLAEPRLMTLEQDGERALLSPIALRDQVVGVLGMHVLDPERTWTEDEIGIVAAVAEQMGLIIENARLFEEARRRAAQERMVREITSRVREALSVEGVLRTAVDEIYRALNLEGMEVRLAPADYDVVEDEGQI